MRVLAAVALFVFAIGAVAAAALAIDRIDRSAAWDWKDWAWLALAATAGIFSTLALAGIVYHAWRSLDLAEEGRSGDRGFGARFVTSAPLVIGVATAVTVIVYILPAQLVENQLEVPEGFWEQ